MPIVKTSAKGQVVIPVEIREKLGIKPGDPVQVTCIDDRRVMIEPLPDDPVEAACGFLQEGPSLTEALLKERQYDRKREDAASARLVRASRLSQSRKRVRKRTKASA